MNNRVLAPMALAAFFLAVVGLSAVLVTAQAPAATAKSTTPAKAVAPPKPAAPAKSRWTLSRTPDGQPDLQGFWTNTTYVPLERPKNVTKEFYTREEAAEMIKRAALVENEQTEPGTVADVHYDFTQFGLDRSQGALAPSPRRRVTVRCNCLLSDMVVQTGDIVNTSPGTSFTPGGCPGWKRM